MLAAVQRWWFVEEAAATKAAEEAAAAAEEAAAQPAPPASTFLCPGLHNIAAAPKEEATAAEAPKAEATPPPTPAEGVLTVAQMTAACVLTAMHLTRAYVSDAPEWSAAVMCHQMSCSDLHAFCEAFAQEACSAQPPAAAGDLPQAADGEP